MKVHPVISVCVLEGVAVIPTAVHPQIRVLISGGFRAPYESLSAEFERTTAIEVTTRSGTSEGNGPSVILTQLGRGVHAGVVSLAREGLDDIMAYHRVLAGTATNIAQTPLALAVRALPGALARVASWLAAAVSRSPLASLSLGDR